jgi:AcrR family transcriptional regulator
MSLTVKSKVEVPELIEKRRGQIIAAAIELFSKNGYHSTTIRDIAKRADVSIGTIYQYVSDKEDVLFLTLIEVLDDYQRYVPAAIESVSQPLARLHAAIRAYCMVNDAKIGATVLAYRETKSLPKMRRKLIQEKELATNRLLTTCITDCVASGLMEEVDVELFTYQIVMFAHAWALKAWRFRPVMTLDEYVGRGIRLMIGPRLTPRGKRAFAKLDVGEQPPSERSGRGSASRANGELRRPR